MLYRSLLGKGLPLNKLAGVAPHRVSFAASNIVLPVANNRTSFDASSVAMAGSPLFVTDLSKPFDLSEIQFVLSEGVCCYNQVIICNVFPRSIHSSKPLVKQKQVHGF